MFLKVKSFIYIPKFILIFFLILFLYGGCSSSSNEEENTCYLPTSTDPCFDPNIDGSTSTVIDQTVEEVILEQESMEGFQGSLEIVNIIKEQAFLFPGEGEPDCPYEQDELVIKTANDWNRFRASCFFSFFDLPDIDFTNEMVLVSLQEFARQGTTIEAALLFANRLSVVIEDEILIDISTPAPAFPINIVSVPRVDLPVNFIRVEKEIVPIEIN